LECWSIWLMQTYFLDIECILHSFHFQWDERWTIGFYSSIISGFNNIFKQNLSNIISWIYWKSRYNRIFRISLFK
jgi:hypothetical protein